MSGLSVLTLVRNREPHLHQLVEGLRRSNRQPDELVVVDMSDRAVDVGPTRFPIRLDRWPTEGLPLAAARNRAAALASHSKLVFLDVDCIPMRDCLGRLEHELERADGLLCADVRYLGPDDARAAWVEEDLLAAGARHTVRAFPESGVRQEANPGLFWSLAFAMRETHFTALGGFDEAYRGYGAEDTDFGFRATESDLPLLFVGGAIACHQHHEGHDPPVQHLGDIVMNARRFHARWGRWPMEGWLAAFQAMGLIDWSAERLRLIRTASSEEIERTRLDRSGALRSELSGDRVARPTVVSP